MAITSAICSSFKQELLQGKHDFDSSGGDTFKIALFTSSASLGAATTDYSTSNEISNTSGSAYTAGGKALTNTGVGLTSTTAFTDFSDVSFTSASFTANGAMIYNTTTDGGSSTTDAVVLSLLVLIKLQLTELSNSVSCKRFIKRNHKISIGVAQVWMGTIHLGPS